MARKLYLAVDLGTSYIKTGVYDIEGNCVGMCRERVSDERPGPGIFIQRGQMLFDTMCQCIKRTTSGLGDQALDICAMSFTGQMAGAMAVDEGWNDVTTWTCSLDTRYIPYANAQRERMGKGFYEISGTNAPVMCSKYEWFKNEFPQEHKRIQKYVMLNGYMIGKLSDIPVSDAKIDGSLIAWTGMADISTLSWSEEIGKVVGIDMSHLPVIVDSTTVGGYLSGKIAKQLNLKSGIPLVLGAGDKVSGCVGAAILEEEDTIFEAGSYGAISSRVKDVRLDYEEGYYDVIAAHDRGSYYAHKYMQGSGISIDWFVESFIRSGPGNENSLKNIETLAESVSEGSENMLAIGALAGSAMPFDGDLRGMFIGHSWVHKKEHFYKALLEGFSYDLTLTFEKIKKNYCLSNDIEIKMIGGGAKSSIWPQILANVTGHTFAVLDREDVAMWGAALLAAKAVGDADSIKEIAKDHVGIKKKFITNEKSFHNYRQYVMLYKDLLRETVGIYKKLNRMKA